MRQASTSIKVSCKPESLDRACPLPAAFERKNALREFSEGSSFYKGLFHIR